MGTFDMRLGPRQRTALCISAIVLANPLNSAQAQDFSVDIPTDSERTDVPPDVRERFDKEFQPIGARVGSFFVYPVVTAGAAVTDNVLATDSAARSDLVVETSASVRFIRPDPVNRVLVTAKVTKTIHEALSTENVLNGAISALFRRGNQTTSGFEVEAQAAWQHIDRRDINDVKDAAKPIPYAVYQGRGEYRFLSGRWRITPGISVRRLDVKNVAARSGGTIDEHYRDYRSIEGNLEARYAMSERLALIGRSSITKIDYDLGPNDAAFNALLDLDRDSLTYKTEAGVGMVWSPTLASSFTAGYSRRKFDARVNRPIDSGGFSFTGDLVWQPDPSSAIKLDVSRGFSESASRDIAGFRTLSANLRGERAVARGVIFGLEGALRHLEPIGPADNSTYYRAQADLTWYFTRRYRLIGKVSYSRRDTDLVDDSFQELRASATLISAF